MGKITEEDVIKLANLSKISLSNDQVKKFTIELESLLEYVDQLQAVNTEGLQPTNQVTGLVNVMREDIEVENISPSELLKNAPDVSENQIRVRRVIE